MADKKNEGNKDLSRRQFIKNTGIATGGVVGGALLGGFIENPFKSEEQSGDKEELVDPGEARMFFTRFADFIVLAHATECIFPKDDNGPGAIGLDVPYFIDKQLAGLWGVNGTDYRQGPFPNTDQSTTDSMQTRGQIYLSGLRKMNELSQKEYEVTFDKAEEEQQIEILEAFENDEVELKGVSSASFFQMLRTSTIEGAYSDPLYGGNKNMEGWKMKEFPGAYASYADVIESEEFVQIDPISLTDYQQK